MIRVHSCDEKRIRSLSKRPRVTYAKMTKEMVAIRFLKRSSMSFDFFVFEIALRNM